MGKRYGTSVTLAMLLASGLTVFAQKPANAPAKATAQCTDGTFSTAKTEKGACSKHGGVKTWFGEPATGAAAKGDTKADAGKARKEPAKKESTKAPSDAPGKSATAGPAPAGATGQCSDGTYTRAKTQAGGCSKHGGVKTWFATDTPNGAAVTHAPTPAAKAPTATPAQPAPSAPAAKNPPAQKTAPGDAPVTGSGKAATVAPPAGTPDNATAKCKDGTYSFAKGHSGACSRHGGVAEWYK